MIGEQGQPLLTDLSSSKIDEGMDMVLTNSKGVDDYYRWTAPEMVADDSIRLTPESDIFSFGMTIIELLTGKVPFSDLRTTQVIFAVASGKRPSRPTGEKWTLRVLTDPLWELIEACWAQRPEDRINIHTFLERLKPLLDSDGPPKPPRKPSPME